MKLGKIEGEPQEIKDFFENNGLVINDFIERPERPIHRNWILFPGILCIFFALATPYFDGTLKLLVFLLGAAMGAWGCVAVLIKFNNRSAAIASALGMVLILLVAYGVLPIEDILKYVEKWLGTIETDP